MTETGPTREPEDDGLFRGLFARREPSPAAPSMTPAEARIAASVQETVDERVSDGMRTLEQQAAGLLREVATEVWRTSARDVRPEQERIMTLLSRDQAIRSLITSSDERFQTLAVRTARLEDHLQDLAESERRTREAMETSAGAIREIAGSPTLHGVDVVRTQLEQVEMHIAEAFAHMDERDRHLTETVLNQVRDHGELIANETTRVVEAMQAYVQGGAEAVGRLAQRIEEHAQLFITQDHNITEHVREAVEEQTQELAGLLAMVHEKVGLHGREQEDMRARVEHLIEARVRGLAELIRADSNALRDLIESREVTVTADGVAFDETAVTRVIDDRLAAMGTLMQERMAALERTIGEEVLALSTAMHASVERNLDRMVTAAGSVDGIDEMAAETQGAFQEQIISHLDDRMMSIARLDPVRQPGARREGDGARERPAGRRSGQRDRRGAPPGPDALDQGAAGGDGQRHARLGRPPVPGDVRPAAPRRAGPGRGDAEDRRAALGQDRPAHGPGRRGRGRRPADRRGPDVGRDQGHVGREPARHRVVRRAVPAPGPCGPGTPCRRRARA